MKKFNTEYAKYLEKNEIYAENNVYVIWYQSYGTCTGTKTIYNPDKTDEVSCEKAVAISDPIKTDIIFYTKSEAEKYCREHSSEDVEYWFVEENTNEYLIDAVV